MELSVVPTLCVAKIVPIFAQIWRVTGLHVSSNTWRQKIWPNLAVAIKLLHSLFTALFGVEVTIWLELRENVGVGTLLKEIC